MFKFSDSCSLVHYNPTLLISRSSRKRLLVMTAQTLQEGQDAFHSWRKTVRCFCFVILQKDSVFSEFRFRKRLNYIYIFSHLHCICPVWSGRWCHMHFLFTFLKVLFISYCLPSYSLFSFLCSSFSLFAIIICCIGCAVCTSGGCAYLRVAHYGNIWSVASMGLFH